MLHFQCDRSREFLREGDQIECTNQLCVVWELVMAAEAGMNGHGSAWSIGLHGIGWDVNCYTTPTPTIRFGPEPLPL